MGALKYNIAVRNPETYDAVVLLAGEEVPEWATDLVHPDDMESGGGYDSLKVDELKALILTRNEGRDDADKLPVDGKKADLVAALTADDK